MLKLQLLGDAIDFGDLTTEDIQIAWLCFTNSEEYLLEVIASRSTKSWIYEKFQKFDFGYNSIKQECIRFWRLFAGKDYNGIRKLSILQFLVRDIWWYMQVRKSIKRSFAGTTSEHTNIDYITIASREMQLILVT